MPYKPGVVADIPGFGPLEIWTLVTDYTGTLSSGGRLTAGVEERLLLLATFVDVHVLTSDTFGTAGTELRSIPLCMKTLEGQSHDVQKAAYVRDHFVPKHVAAFGNGVNDRLLLRTVKEGGGLAIAVDNGEGCAVEALLSAHVLIKGAANALDLLLEPKRLIADLRY